jgi:hypothetical protein
VNGKALVNGLQLASMDSSDMLDVLHYFFEEDISYASNEQAEARDKSRTEIYESMYLRSYKYSSSNRGDYSASSMRDFDEPEQVDEIQPFNPAQKPKGYTAPTKLDENSSKPFGTVLDAPLG